jgi:hypothetical protein
MMRKAVHARDHNHGHSKKCARLSIKAVLSARTYCGDWYGSWRPREWNHRRHGCDLPQGFRTRSYVRDWLPIRREQCAKRVSRKSRWSRSSARRIASRCRWWPSGTGSASRRSTHGAKRFGGFQANEVKRPIPAGITFVNCNQPGASDPCGNRCAAYSSPTSIGDGRRVNGRHTFSRMPPPGMGTNCTLVTALP